MGGTLLVEFITPGRFHGGWNFPFIKGMLASAGLTSRWLRFGLEASVQVRNDEHGIGLDSSDEATLLRVAEALPAKTILFSTFPAPRLVDAIAAACPEARMGVVDGNQRFVPNPRAEASRAPEVLALDVEKIRGWLGLAPGKEADSRHRLLSIAEPDYGYEPANELAREASPVVHILTGKECSYRRPLGEGDFWQSHRGTSIAGSGCAFCSSPKNSTTVTAKVSEACDALRRQLLAAVRTHPYGKEPLSLRIRGVALTENPLALAQTIVEARIVQCRLLLDYRADRIVALAQQLHAAVQLLGANGHRLEVCLVGVESFSAGQLDRYNKGFGPEANLACVRVLRQLEAEFPQSFWFQTHRGLSTILFDPWVTLGDLALNLAVVNFFQLEALCGKLLTSRLRLEPGLPLEAAARQDGLTIDHYSDPYFDTARRNFYPDEIPWKFADARITSVCQVLVRLTRESQLEPDALVERIVAWEGRSPGLSPVSRAAQVVRAAATHPNAVEPESLLEQAEQSTMNVQRPRLVTTALECVQELGEPNPDACNVNLLAFDRGLKTVIKIELNGTEQEIANREQHLTKRWPDAFVRRRKPAWGALGDWEVFAARDQASLASAVRLAEGIETERNEALLEASIAEMGRLLGYPTCCAMTFARASAAYRTRNEWLWIRRRVEAAEQISPEFNPFVVGYVPCSLACQSTTELVRAVLGNKDLQPIPWWGRFPTLLLLERPGEFVQFAFQDPDSNAIGRNAFRYKVASALTSDSRLKSVLLGDTLVVEPGLVRILEQGQEIAFFALDAFLWWTERVFHREFWLQCLRQLETPGTESSTVGDSPVGSSAQTTRKSALDTAEQAVQRGQVRAALESVLYQLSAHPSRVLGGFVPDGITERASDRGWGELAVSLRREDERLNFLVQARTDAQSPFQSTTHLALCFFNDTPPDTTEKEHILRTVLSQLERRIFGMPQK